MKSLLIVALAILAPALTLPLRAQTPAKDTIVVKDSQENALEKVQALEEQASDARGKALLEAVEQEMDKALKHLTTATNSPAALAEALAAEQAAYQALLKLSAHEYQVSRSKSQSRSSSSQSSSQQRSQRQVDELDLKQSENRYETQRQATPQQSPEQREQLQVLNRLKELAQRQQDLNERLKELQTSLQEAKTEKEKEEIRRRLKRLREEEKDMLADVDELRQRMDKPENQSRMAEARQQLDQTRSQVQQANEALDKESVQDALASGTRAQRDLQKLRDDFRKQNSGQFTDQMRQMRSEARDLAQKEEEISKKLDSLVDNQKKSLSDSGDSKALADQLQKQKSTFTNLLENMRRVSEEAETAEPLLSKQLYDTLRKTSQEEARSLKDTTENLLRSGMLSRSLYDKLKSLEQEPGSKSLEATSELLDQKMLPQASQAEQTARQGIDNLKRGVEHAAESILGDDTEALRQAKRELDDLTRQLDNEIAQADPSRTNQSKGQSGQKGQSGDQQNQNAQQQGAQGNQPSDQASKGQGQDPDGQSQQGKEGQQGQGQQGQQGQGQQGQGQQGQGQQGQGQQGQGQQGQGQEGQANAQGQPNDGRPGQPRQARGGAGTQPSDQINPPDGNPGQRTRAGQRAGSSRRSLRDLMNDDGGAEGGGEGGGNNRATGPLTSEDFSAWSDRLRDVEEMIDLPDARTEVARVRERARAVRLESKQKKIKPDWAVVKLQIAKPLSEVRDRIAEELARRQNSEALVPIDRDPVPAKFSELVRKYYEKLGGSDAPGGEVKPPTP